MSRSNGHTGTARAVGVAPRSTLIETFATADAQADGRAGADQCYHLMEAFVASGDVQREAWDRYCAVYAAVRACLAVPAPRTIGIHGHGHLLQR